MVQANFPRATARPEQRRFAKGAVGDFVFIDCEHLKLLGRITEVRVPESERLTIEPKLGEAKDPNPLGRIQLLATVDLNNMLLQRGLKTHPRIGDGVYLARDSVFADLLANSTNRPDDVTLSVGSIDSGNSTPVAMKLAAEKLFGRHCGVLGATGGGKSWTIATLIQQIKEAGGRAILFDPTGEFAAVPTIDKHYTFNQKEGDAEIVHFPYRMATEDDLFTLFRPSGQSQGPKLREAFASLKLVSAFNGNVPDGISVVSDAIVKQGQSRKPFYDALEEYSDAIHNPRCDFDIGKLSAQVANECVWSTAPGNSNSWGGPDNSLSYCEPVIARIRTLVNSHELSCLFKETGSSLVSILDDFIKNENGSDIIRISFKNVRFEHHTREILLNIIGRYVLSRAREGAFRDKPMVVFLDEAHQFLGRSVGDEYASVSLDSFGLIAKEGRKYGLSCVLATQRPRDIPADVLSQLGTLIVHRLTNDHDREVVERACGDLDRDAATFIPTLAPGEAILVGPDIPAPVPLLIKRPSNPPDSKGPDFNSYWTGRQNAKRSKTGKAALKKSTQVKKK